MGKSKWKCSGSVNGGELRSSSLRKASNMLGQIRQIIIPSKPHKDRNNYRIIKLRNGILVCLVSRNTTSYDTRRASSEARKQRKHLLNPFCFTNIAFSVDAGGKDDPKNIPGVFHLIEHVIHDGSETYPALNERDSILNSFGYSDASTDDFKTFLSFGVSNLLLEKVFDMYIDLITNPLFIPEMVKREVLAVDSEFWFVLPNIIKPILQSTLSISNRPFLEFNCGNLSTLGENEITLAAQLKKMHSLSYIASKIRVTMSSSSKSLDELEELAIRYLLKIPENETDPATTPSKLPTSQTLYSGLNFVKPNRIIVEGSGSFATLTVFWYLPDITRGDTSKTLTMLSRLIADTNPGGLNYYLREKQLAFKLVPRCRQYHETTMLEIVVYLTQSGFVESTQIEIVILEYILFLALPSNKFTIMELFRMEKAEHMKQYEYQDHTPTSVTSAELVKRLHYLDDPSNIVIEPSWKCSSFDYGKILAVLRNLNRQYMRVFMELPICTFLSAYIPEKKVHILEISKTRYVVDEIKHCDFDLTGSKFDFSLNSRYGWNYLCKKNLHATSQSLIVRNLGNIGRKKLRWKNRDKKKDPVVVSGVHYGHFVNQDYRFSGKIDIYFESTHVDWSVGHNLQLLWLSCCVGNERVNPYESSFSSMGYKLSIGPTRRGLSISCSGFYHHIVSILEIGLDALIFPSDENSKHDKLHLLATSFALAKPSLAQIWENHLSNCHAIADSFLKYLTCGSFLFAVDYSSLAAVNFEQVKQFMFNFFVGVTCRISIHGNIPISAFNEIAALVYNKLKGRLEKEKKGIFLDGLLQTNNGLPGSPGAYCYMIKNMSSYPCFTAHVTNYYYIYPDPWIVNETSVFKAAMRFLSSHVFFILRTVKQVGYHVNTNTYRVNFTDYDFIRMQFAISVTSTATKYTTCEVNSEIDALLSSFGDFIQEMSQELFDYHVKTVMPNIFMNA